MTPSWPLKVHNDFPTAGSHWIKEKRKLLRYTFSKKGKGFIHWKKTFIYPERTKWTSFKKAFVHLNWWQLRVQATSQLKQNFSRRVKINRKRESMLFLNTKNYQIQKKSHFSASAENQHTSLAVWSHEPDTTSCSPLVWFQSTLYAYKWHKSTVRKSIRIQVSGCS